MLNSFNKNFIEEVYEKAIEKIFKEEAKEAEPLTQPKTYFDKLMEAAQVYEEDSAYEKLDKI